MSSAVPVPGSRGLAVVPVTTASRGAETRAARPDGELPPAHPPYGTPLPAGAALRHDEAGRVVDVREAVTRLVDPSGGVEPRHVLGRPVTELLVGLGPADPTAGPDGLLVAGLRRVGAPPLPVQVVVWPGAAAGPVEPSSSSCPTRP